MTKEIHDLDLFIRDVLTYVETENKGFDSLGFAGGESGMSYGNAQNDCAKNGDARDALLGILIADGVTRFDPRDIVKLAATPGITDTAFIGAGYYDIVKKAVQNQATLVAEMDAVSFARVRVEVNKAIAGAAKNKHGRGALDPSNPDPEAIAWMAVWANSAPGGLDDFAKYVAGDPVHYKGRDNVIPGAPSAANIFQYIADQKEARKRPRAFTNRQTRVRDGLKIALAHQQLIANPPPGQTPRRMNQNLPGGPEEGTTRLAGDVDHESPSVAAAHGPAAPASTSSSSPLSLSGAESIPVSLSVDSLPTSSLLAASAPLSAPSAFSPDAQPAADASSTPTPVTNASSRLGGRFRLAGARIGQALRNLTPARFGEGSPGGGPSGGAQASLASVLPGLGDGLVFDTPAGTATAAHEIEATPLEAPENLGEQRNDTVEAKERVAEDTAQSVAEAETDIGAAFNAAATQSERPTSVTVGGRVFTREEVMAQITISADGLSSSWTIPQPTATVEPPLTEKRIRQLIREGINEWDSGFGVRYRSRHYIPRRRG